MLYANGISVSDVIGIIQVAILLISNDIGSPIFAPTIIKRTPTMNPGTAMKIDTKNIPIPSTGPPGRLANHIAKGTDKNNETRTARPEIVNDTPIFLHKKELIFNPGCIAIERTKCIVIEFFRKCP